MNSSVRKTEKSCGAVVFCQTAEGRRYVLVCSGDGLWGFPKGHTEPGETEEQTALREVREETGYTLTSYRFRGLVTFVSGNGITEYMSLFTADGFEGKPVPCDEGDLEWVEKSRIGELDLWEGDKIFLRLLAEEAPFFSLKLVYDGGDRLVAAALNGKELELPR